MIKTSSHSSIRIKTRFKPLMGSGDDGLTSLPGRGTSRISKNSVRIRACAAIDEVNCMLGLCRAYIKTDKAFFNEIKKIQHTLIYAGASAAGLGEVNYSKQLLEKTLCIKKLIKILSKKLPIISRFVIPGDSMEGALLHCARSSCRTAETLLTGIPGTKRAGAYLNHLSNFLFQLARLADDKRNL